MRHLCLVPRHRLLSTSPPRCLLFTGRLSCRISLCRHLASPFVMPLPHMSILYPPPSFALAGCCVASCCAASTSRPHIHRHCHRHLVEPWPLVSLSRLLVASPHCLHCGLDVCGCVVVLVCIVAHCLGCSVVVCIGVHCLHCIVVVCVIICMLSASMSAALLSALLSAALSSTLSSAPF
jgi:hypothetical protein